MRKRIALLITLIFPLTIYSQIQFGERTVLSSVVSGVSDDVEVADYDNDGDNDVFLLFSGKLVLHINTNGLGDFSEQIVVTNNLMSARSISVGDINGDGFLDVVVAETAANKIIWFENLAGTGTFSSERVVNKYVEEVIDIHLADFDGDGDLDLLSSAHASVSSNSDNTIWFKNLDGLGSFSEGIYLADIPSERIHPSDLDDDGDLDIIISFTAENSIFWLDNLNGEGVFSDLKLISSNIVDCLNVEAADFDLDGDQDVLAISITEDYIQLLKNDGGENFSKVSFVTNETDFPTSTISADFDNDGDLDIVSTSFLDNKVAYYENLDGQGTFGVQNIIDDSGVRPVRVKSSDLDNDGKLDILVSYHGSREGVWYRNESILGINENNLPTIKIYPNPASKEIVVQFPDSFYSIDVYDASGKLTGNYKTRKIDITTFASGLYFLKINNNRGQVYTSSFIKR